MNYITEAEKYLRHYNSLKYSLDQMEREIAKLIWDGIPSSNGVTDYAKEPTGSFFQEEMIHIVCKLQQYKEMQKETLDKIGEIDTVLDELENDYRNFGQVLRLWYIEKLNKEEIAEELNYSSKTSIYDIKYRAIKELSIRLFGIRALNAI